MSFPLYRASKTTRYKLLLQKCRGVCGCFNRRVQIKNRIRNSEVLPSTQDLNCFRIRIFVCMYVKSFYFFYLKKEFLVSGSWVRVALILNRWVGSLGETGPGRSHCIFQSMSRSRRADRAWWYIGLAQSRPTTFLISRGSSCSCEMK